LPERFDAKVSLIEGMMERGRFDDAMRMIEGIHQEDPVHYTGLMCQVYLKLGFAEGCDAAIEQISNLPLTPYLFGLRVDSMIRRKRFDELMDYMEEASSSLRRNAYYWRKRMYTTVYYGHFRGDEWYQANVSRSMENYARLSGSTLGALFDIDLCDARFAYEMEQYSRAIRSANKALSRKPGNPQALSILEKARKALIDRSDL